MEQFQWEQTSEGTMTLDLRLECKEDGTTTIHNLKQTGQQNTFGSREEAIDYMASQFDMIDGQPTG